MKNLLIMQENEFCICIFLAVESNSGIYNRGVCALKS